MCKAASCLLNYGKIRISLSKLFLGIIGGKNVEKFDISIYRLAVIGLTTCIFVTELLAQKSKVAFSSAML
jgi:hypothetical protein